MHTNQMHDIYNPGTDLTCVATQNVKGKTFAAIAAPRGAGNIAVKTAQPGAAACGVFKYDADNEELVGIARGASRIVTITAEGTITAGAPVEVGTGGKAKAHSDGIEVGYAVDSAKDGEDAQISLNR